MATIVDLGYAEVVSDGELFRLSSKYFPCKIGGKPAWLAFDKLPSAEELQCKTCLKQTSFLMQLYAPIEGNPNAFHRSIFMFVCTNAICVSPTILCFRSQLERKNRFYSSDPPNYSESEEESNLVKLENSGVNLCELCGCSANKKCGACHEVWYCSKEHQTWDWKEGKHKVNCGKEITRNSKASDKFRFEEYELVIEPEEGLDEAESDVEDEVSEYKKLLEKIKPSCQNENLDQYDPNNDDKSFDNFNRVISKHKNQIVRYYRYDNKADCKPLWVTDANQLNELPPICENCGSNRAFEFQIMPQVINHLSKEIALDIATIAVFTCKNNCVSEDQSYFKEFVYCQKYVEQNPEQNLLNENSE